MIGPKPKKAACTVGCLDHSLHTFLKHNFQYERNLTLSNSIHGVYVHITKVIEVTSLLHTKQLYFLF